MHSWLSLCIPDSSLCVCLLVCVSWSLTTSLFSLTLSLSLALSLVPLSLHRSDFLTLKCEESRNKAELGFYTVLPLSNL